MVLQTRLYLPRAARFLGSGPEAGFTVEQPPGGWPIAQSGDGFLAGVADSFPPGALRIFVADVRGYVVRSNPKGELRVWQPAQVDGVDTVLADDVLVAVGVEVTEETCFDIDLPSTFRLPVRVESHDREAAPEIQRES